MFSDDIKRPNYRDGQYLGPRDFVAEQTYHRDMRRRLSLGQHTWGIYTGLELVEQPREGSATAVDLFISPGLAVDGFGRELVNFAPFKLEPSLFARFTVDQWVEVWIAYETEGTDPPRPGYELCDDPDFAERTRETFRVEVGPRTNPRDPIVVAGAAVPVTIIDPTLPVEASVPSVPHQALPDDEERARWLIQLGWVHWDGGSGFVAIQKSAPGDPPTADELKLVDGRHYGGAVSAHTYAINNTWELVSRRPPPAGGTPPRAEGFIRGRLTVEDLLIAKGQGIELHNGALTLLTAAGADNGNPLTLSRSDRGDGGAEIRAQLGTATTGKNRFVFASDADKVRVLDSGNISILGGRLDLHKAANADAQWGLKVDPASEVLQFTEPDDNDRVVFEVLDVGDDTTQPVIRLHGEVDATLSADQLIDLTDGGETLLHTHRSASTLLKGMVEIAAAGESAATGESGARLVIPADDPRLLSQTEKDELTGLGLTSLHRHPNGILNNVEIRSFSAHGQHSIFGPEPDTQFIEINLGVAKRVVALIYLRRIAPDGGVDENDDLYGNISEIDGVSVTQHFYKGAAARITFRVHSEDDVLVYAVAVVFYEDL